MAVFAVVDEIQGVHQREGGVEFHVGHLLAPSADAEIERGRFAYLDDFDVPCGSVDGSGGDAEVLARVRSDHVQQALDGIAGAGIHQDRGVHVILPAQPDAGIPAGAHHVPEFLLAEEIVAGTGRLVVGMDAEGHLPAHADMAHAHRELASEIGENVFPDHAVHIHIHYVAHRVAGKPAVVDERIAVSQVGEPEGLGAPAVFVADGAEPERIKLSIFFHAAKVMKKTLSS